MSESEGWTEYRQAQKERRAARLPKRQATIERLASEGFKVDKKTEYHYRINGRLDIYPIHHRYHDIVTNKRGTFQAIHSFVHGFFPKEKK